VPAIIRRPTARVERTPRGAGDRDLMRSSAEPSLELPPISAPRSQSESDSPHELSLADAKAGMLLHEPVLSWPSLSLKDDDDGRELSGGRAPAPYHTTGPHDG